ncbi:MAG: tyrosine--tRNA ligase [Acidobacteriota bacterium]|nr:tyrosine--tRNA ligase [Acidobacteriota bacterium]
MSSGIPPTDEQMELLLRGAVDVVEEDALRQRLEQSRKENRPLLVKTGFDPTAPDLHLGHAVLLRKMAHFQQLGHRVVFLVGDFTAMIGDPTGKKATRPQLSRDEVLANAETYQEQAWQVLDRERTEIRHNSEWLGALGAEGLVRLAGSYTLARMMEREDFRDRFEKHEPISIHELLYPLTQGYDSVVMEADVELGGHDQLLNLLVFGRTMSIPDDLMWDWRLLLTDMDEVEIDRQKRQAASGEVNPRNLKADLAHELVRQFHDRQAADEARAEFDRMFRGGGVPGDVKTYRFPTGVRLDVVIAYCELARSRSEARRLVLQGAVSIDGERTTDPNLALQFGHQPLLLKVGKRRFAKLTALIDPGLS